MNEYDSAKMIDLLKAEEDFELVDSEDQADLLILSTCSIREKAQERVFHQIGRWRKIKEVKPDLKIAIGGCVASQEGEKIIKRAPSVDIVFGPQSLHNLPSYIKIKIQQINRKLTSHFLNLKNLIIYRCQIEEKHQRSYQSLKDVINIVHFVWCQKQEDMRFLEMLRIF